MRPKWIYNHNRSGSRILDVETHGVLYTGEVIWHVKRKIPFTIYVCPHGEDLIFTIGRANAAHGFRIKSYK